MWMSMQLAGGALGQTNTDVANGSLSRKWGEITAEPTNSWRLSKEKRELPVWGKQIQAKENERVTVNHKKKHAKPPPSKMTYSLLSLGPPLPHTFLQQHCPLSSQRMRMVKGFMTDETTRIAVFKVHFTCESQILSSTVLGVSNNYWHRSWWNRVLIYEESIHKQGQSDPSRDDHGA